MTDAPRSPYWKEFAAALPESPIVRATPNYGRRAALPENNVNHIMTQQQYADHYVDQKRQQNQRRTVMAGEIPVIVDNTSDMLPIGKIGKFLANRVIDAATGDSGERLAAYVGNDIKQSMLYPQEHWDQRNQFYQNAYAKAAEQFPAQNNRLPPSLPPAGVPMNAGRYMQREALHPFNWNDYVPSPSQQEFRSA